MKAGSLRHRVTLQRLTITQDSSSGDTTESWTDVATVWAAIEPLSARDFIAAQAEQSKVTARIVIRARDDVTAAMRVKHGQTLYDIEGVLPDKDSGREYITLAVAQGVRKN